MGAALSAPHTGRMLNAARPTTFVTGASGLIVVQLDKLFVTRSFPFRVFGAIDSAQRLRRVGALPVTGCLPERVQWQSEAAGHRSSP